MRIEEIDVDSITGVSDHELYNLRFRMIQLYMKKLRSGSFIDTDELYSKYRIVIGEMERRGLRYNRHEIDEVSKSSYPSAVVVPSYISIIGSYVHDAGMARDIDICIRSEVRDESLEVKLLKVFGGIGKDIHFVYNASGPHSDYIPIYDLVLVDCNDHGVVRVSEGISQLRSYYESMEYDERLERDRGLVSRYIVGRVLDVGGGSGSLSRHYDGSYVCIDSNAVAISLCVSAGIECKLGDARELPYDDNSFDTVVFCHSLEHIDDIWRAISEGERVASRRILIVLPLNSSRDRSHEHEFTLDDLDRFVGYDRIVVDDNTVILIKDKVSKGIVAGIKPVKPRMAVLTEAFSVGEIAEWIGDREVAVEPKYNGLRMMIQKIGDEVSVWTDSLNRIDLGEYFSDIRNVSHDVVLDCSVTIYRGSKVLPRIELMKLLGKDLRLEEDEVVCAIVFDIPYYDGDITGKKYIERRRILERVYNSLRGSRNFELSEYRIVRGVDRVKVLWERYSRLPQSEGVMLKYVDSVYEKVGVTSQWAKVKKELEIKVKVLEVTRNRAGVMNYLCGLLRGGAKLANEVIDGRYIVIGKTFSTKIDVKVGDILTVGVTEIIPGDRISWVAPRVIDIDTSISEPYYVEQVLDLARRHNILQVAKAEGNIDYNVGDRGHGVLQLHIMGIDEIGSLRAEADRIYSIRQDIEELRSVLLDVVGEQSCHIDFRLNRDGDEYFEGGEILVGNITGLGKLSRLDEGGKLRWAFKVPHAEDPDVEVVRGSRKWMEVGFGGIDIFEPGSVGATKNKYSAMIGLDRFRFEVVQNDRHAKKIEIVGSKIIPEGIYLIAYVPVEDGRVWMVNYLRKSLDIGSAFIVKSEEERIVCGIVYSPGEVDAQGDYTTEEEIRKASYRFMESVQKFKINHSEPVVARILESYIAPVDLAIDGYFVSKGSWILTTRILSDELWEMVKSGAVTGYSMHGSAIHIGER